MSSAIIITASILGVVGILSGTYWIIVQFRMRRIADYTPSLAEGLWLRARVRVRGRKRARQRG